MNDDLHLPPHRALPPDLRERLRDRVRAEINSEVRRPEPWFRRGAPILVAAAAAAVALGVAVVVGNVSGGKDRSATSKNADLNRCWRAVERVGKADEYPPVDTWRITQQMDGFAKGVAMVVARSEDTYVFCGLTPSTVRVSAPVAATRSEVRPILALPNGPMAGVSDGRKNLALTIGHRKWSGWITADARLDRTREAFVSPRALTAQSFLALTTTEEHPDMPDPPKEKDALPGPPPPNVRVIDRPAVGGDPARRAALEDCMGRKGDETMIAADAATPKAMVRMDGRTTIVATKDAEIMLCNAGAIEEPQEKRVDATATKPVAMQVRWTGAMTSDKGTSKVRTAMGGYVHPRVAKLTFANNGRTYEADVYQGTFAVAMSLTLPSEDANQAFDHPERAWPVPAKAYNANGDLVWSGLIEPQR